MLARCLFLKPIKGAGGDLPAVADRYPAAVEIDHYALHETDLSAFRAILLPAHLDQRYLGGEAVSSVRISLPVFIEGSGGRIKITAAEEHIAFLALWQG